MALLFADDPAMIKCTSCGSTTFKEVPVYTYKKIKDRQGDGLQKELIQIHLECTICGKRHKEIMDLRKHRVLEKPE